MTNTPDGRLPRFEFPQLNIFLAAISSMSDQLAPPFPGAYYIRNKKTSTVLHTDKVCLDGDSRVLTYNQEVQFGNQQIWWIEPLPDYADKTDPTYFITTPGSGRALDVVPGECISSNATLISEIAYPDWARSSTG